MSARGILIEGSLYMAPYINGVKGKKVGPLEGTQLDIKVNVQQKDMTSRGKGTFGMLLESVAVQQPGDISITFAEGSADVIALGLMGSVQALTQTSGNLADVAVPDVVKGSWIPLSKAHLTGNPTLKNNAASTTYVEGTDYEVNKDRGWLWIYPSSAIADGDDLKFSSAYGAYTGSSIDGGAQPNLRIELSMDGRNMADGTLVHVDVWEAIVAPSAAMQLLSGEFLNVPLAGRMKLPVGKTAPFNLKLLTAS